MRCCMTALRAGAGLVRSRSGEEGLRVGKKVQQGWTGGAFTAGIAVTAIHSNSWMAAAPSPPADAVALSDRQYDLTAPFFLDWGPLGRRK